MKKVEAFVSSEKTETVLYALESSNYRVTFFESKGMGKAPQHYRSRKIRKYFEEHKATLIHIFLPTASPEFMV